MNFEPWNEFYNRVNLKISWPSFEHDHEAYLHAVGSLSHYWNLLEDTFYIYLQMSRIPDSVARYIGYKLNNADKMEIMNILADEFDASNPEAFERARIFFRYARICAANRNFILHASLNRIENGVFKLQKKSRGNVGRYSVINIGIDELRTMSQDISNTAQFGARLAVVMLHFTSGYSTNGDGTVTHWRLLDAPPIPINWEKFSCNKN